MLADGFRGINSACKSFGCRTPGRGGALASSRAQEGGAMTNKWSIHTAQSSWTNEQRDSIEVIGSRRPSPTPDRCEMKCWSNGHAAISRVFCSWRLQHLALLGCSNWPTHYCWRSFVIYYHSAYRPSLPSAAVQGPRGAVAAVRSTWADPGSMPAATARGMRMAVWDRGKISCLFSS